MELGLAKTAPLSVIGVELIPQEEASLRYPDRWAVILAKYASCAQFKPSGPHVASRSAALAVSQALRPFPRTGPHVRSNQMLIS
jgi:hypothetical protein